MASVEFLGSVGFKTHRPHARHPRMRMDLRSALTWRDEVEAALEKLIGVVRPVPKPSTERPSRSDARSALTRAEPTLDAVRLRPAKRQLHARHGR